MPRSTARCRSRLPGAGGAATPIELDGTTAAADLDIAGGAAKVTFAVPALFNVTGELIAVDGTTTSRRR